MKRTLVVGSDGYIGSVLYPKLQNDSYFGEVVGLDSMFYSDSRLYIEDFGRKIIKKDIREVAETDLSGFDIVFYLSDLNDPTSIKYPKLKYDIDRMAAQAFMKKCKNAGVREFVYSSSASVYGFLDGEASEDSPLNPLTPYAECKSDNEKFLQSITDERFHAICSRNATVYGLSPNIRFDLVVNYLCGSAIAKGIIELTSNGCAIRPFAHVEDICNAYISLVKLPIDMRGNFLIINNGDNSNNYLVFDIAKQISHISGCKIIYNRNNPDKRSYGLNADKLNKLGVKHQKNINAEIEKMLDFFKQIQLTESFLDRRTHTRLKQIDYLLDTDQLSEDLIWKGKADV